MLPRRGEYFACLKKIAKKKCEEGPGLTGYWNRFGWVNASYIYGLQIVNAHMRRALGTLTPYETFVKALEENRNKTLAELV